MFYPLQIVTSVVFCVAGCSRSSPDSPARSSLWRRWAAAARLRRLCSSSPSLARSLVPPPPPFLHLTDAHTQTCTNTQSPSQSLGQISSCFDTSFIMSYIPIIEFTRLPRTHLSLSLFKNTTRIILHISYNQQIPAPRTGYQPQAYWFPLTTCSSGLMVPSGLPSYFDQYDSETILN